MYLKLNNRAEMLLNYRKTIKIDEDFIIPYISLAGIYYERNNLYEVVKCCLKELRINPGNDKANYILSMAYKTFGRKKYVKCLKKATVCANDDAVGEFRNMRIDLR
jgi:tetratricopeptide (TPR) repeat protein